MHLAQITIKGTKWEDVLFKPTSAADARMVKKFRDDFDEWERKRREKLEAFEKEEWAERERKSAEYIEARKQQKEADPRWK